jgi:osmotically-inducible protein OsmY
MASRLFRRRRRRARGLGGGLAGLAAGAGLMYFLDPRRGARRRSEISQRAQRVLKDVEGTVEAGARDLEHRARGLAHEARARVSRDAPSDEVLVERVRAKLGRLTSHPSAIEVQARDGRVELSGPILASEHARVVVRVRLVRGVRGVEDRLEPHEAGDGVPALQDGPGREPGAALRGQFTPGDKLLFGAAGAALLARALFGRGLLRLPAAIVGLAFLRRFLAEPGAAGREARKVARAASEVAAHERERRSDRGSHSGAWHGEAEVEEVKSPAELEARSGRRGTRRGEGGERRGPTTGEERDAAPALERIDRGPDYVAPPPGSRVHEEDLGFVVPREAEGEARREGPGGEGTGEDGSPPRGEPR